jgi:hypothetical protein
MDETYATGMLAGMSVNRTYDARFRIGRIELKQNGATQTRQRFS